MATVVLREMLVVKTHDGVFHTVVGLPDGVIVVAIIAVSARRNSDPAVRLPVQIELDGIAGRPVGEDDGAVGSGVADGDRLFIGGPWPIGRAAVRGRYEVRYGREFRCGRGLERLGPDGIMAGSHQQTRSDDTGHGQERHPQPQSDPSVRLDHSAVACFSLHGAGYNSSGVIAAGSADVKGPSRNRCLPWRMAGWPRIDAIVHTTVLSAGYTWNCAATPARIAGTACKAHYRVANALTEGNHFRGVSTCQSQRVATCTGWVRVC